MLATCSFRHERVREESLVELDAEGASAKVCPSCLVLIIVHRRIHRMRLERLIPQMAAKA